MSKKDVIVLNSHGVGQYAYADHMPVWGETLCVTKWHVAEDGGRTQAWTPPTCTAPTRFPPAPA